MLSWAARYRWGKALLAAVGTVGILVWALYSRHYSPRLIRTERVQAVVKEVKRASTGELHTRYGVSPGIEIARVVLVLPDGEEVKVTFLDFPPEPGEKIPLVIQHFSDGSRRFIFDEMEWMINR